MNEIVKYENQLNEVPLRNFNPVDLDLLMYFCHKFKGKKGEVITFDFSEIKQAIGYQKHKSKDFIDDLVGMNAKLLSCNFMIHEDSGAIEQFTLFSKFRTDPKTQTLTANINKDFQFLLNKESENWYFTRFELDSFLSIKSSYAKECFRRLKQFRTSGEWIVKIDEFRRLLDVPESYKMCDIDRWVLKPIEKELSSHFENLKITKIKKRGRGRGGVVDRLHFTFEKETVEKSSYIEHHETNKNGSKAKIEPRETGFICEKCGKPLYEMILNGNNCWCHNFKVQGDDCKQIYNSIAEVKGYDEEPDHTQQVETDNADYEYNRQKIKEILDSLGN